MNTDVVSLHARAVELFLDRVRTVPDDRWGAATPCSDWDVRTLVNHVVGEERWTVPLMEGKTIDDVGSALDGDLLGDSPKEAAEAAGKAAIAAFAEPGAADRTVHLSFGDTPAAEYAWQLFTDHLVHAWDLAVATGADSRLDDDLVEACAAWFANWERMYRDGGAVGTAVPVGPDATAQDRLLGSFGRDPGWHS
jgi:uncharacterized protein (TIGR03086 family)